jgi:drug/metabolite transporter (DMT)-like permease
MNTPQGRKPIPWYWIARMIVAVGTCVLVLFGTGKQPPGLGHSLIAVGFGLAAGFTMDAVRRGYRRAQETHNRDRYRP